MSKKMIIKGVGTFMAKRVPTDPLGAVEVITLGTMQDLKIDLNVELEDVFGGDGLFAIDTLVKSKSIEISATDAKFDLSAIQLMMGSSITESKEDYVHVLNEQATATASTMGTTPVNIAVVAPEFADTMWSSPDIQVRLKDTNTLLDLVTFDDTTAPTASQFMWDATEKQIVLNPAHVGKDAQFNYKRTETVDVVDILADEVPFPVSIVHHGSFQQKDGSFAGVETELFMCRAKGNFTIDAQRATASTTQVALQVLDPERADSKLGSIKRFSTNTSV